MKHVNDDLKITDEDFNYLRLQCGEISSLLVYNKEGQPVFGDNSNEKWEIAYNDLLYKRFISIFPFLPARAQRILDIGSGMGGTDILLHRHYADYNPTITLVDGEDDPPSHVKADVTFNDKQQTQSFWHNNGITNMEYVNAKYAGRPATMRGKKLEKQDIILSFQAYCFHFSPAAYLDFVKDATKPGTVLIFDVRRDKEEWRKILTDAFGEGVDLMEREKWTRTVFHAT